MTGTAVAVLPAQLPAFLQTAEALQDAAKFNDQASGGIKAGGFPRISTKGGKFFIVDASAPEPRRLITDSNNLPINFLDVIILGAAAGVSKLFYAGKYVEGSDAEPDCSSDSGALPDPHIQRPVHVNCAQCPNNQWGSKISETGSEIKACGDSKRIVVIPAMDLAFKALAFSIPASALKEWGAFVRTLNRAGNPIPVYGVVTRITFDPKVSYPKPLFTFQRLVSAEEYAVINERRHSDEVKNIENPIRSAPPAVPLLAAPTAPIIPIVPVQPAVAAAPVAQPQPAPVAAPAPAPAAPAMSFGAPAAPVQPTPTPDPLAGLPPEQVAAINAVGGIDSVAGKTVLAALRTAAGVNTASGQVPGDVGAAAAQAAQAVAASMETPPKTRRTRTTKPPEPAAPAAPEPGTMSFGGAPAAPAPAAPAPAPAPVQTSFASAPAAAVASSSSDALADDISKMLAGVLGAPATV